MFASVLRGDDVYNYKMCVGVCFIECVYTRLKHKQPPLLTSARYKWENLWDRRVKECIHIGMREALSRNMSVCLIAQHQPVCAFVCF